VSWLATRLSPPSSGWLLPVCTTEGDGAPETPPPRHFPMLCFYVLLIGSCRWGARTHAFAHIWIGYDTIAFERGNGVGAARASWASHELRRLSVAQQLSGPWVGSDGGVLRYLLYGSCCLLLGGGSTPPLY